MNKWILGFGFLPLAVLAAEQQGVLHNSSTDSATNAAVSATLSGVRGTSVHLYQIDAFCSAGSGTLAVTDGGTTIWDSVGSEVGTSRSTFNWDPGLTGTDGKDMVITLGACGAGNTGTLQIQGDRY